MTARARQIELIRARSLFVRVWPIPSSLSERRAVLRALQRYGEIEVFKKLTEPDTWICAPARLDTANALTQRSPLTFKFMSETIASIRAKSQPIITPSTVAAPIVTHEQKQWDDTAHNEERDTGGEESDLTKTFTLRIHSSQEHYKHKTSIRLNPLHGPWPHSRDEDRDFASIALSKVVPDNIAAPGLCNWYTAGQLADNSKHMRLSGESAKSWHIRDRMLRRERRQPIPDGGQETLAGWSSVNNIAHKNRS